MKRTANEIYYPNVFELPSGNIDLTDENLARALEREVREETGFRVVKIVAELEPFYYDTRKEVGGNIVRKSCVQLNYVVEVDGVEIRVNAEEHEVGVLGGRGGVGGVGYDGGR